MLGGAVTSTLFACSSCEPGPVPADGRFRVVDSSVPAFVGAEVEMRSEPRALHLLVLSVDTPEGVVQMTYRHYGKIP